MAPPGTRPAPGSFARWATALDRIDPDFYRLVVHWRDVQPAPDRPPDWDRPQHGCMRDELPCAPWAGVRDQLRALGRQQTQGRWQALVVLAGTPDWAAEPEVPCGPRSRGPAGRTPRADALPAYAVLVQSLLRLARAEGVELRYWSPWNEPNHPVTLRPQRARCARTAPPLAPGRYARLARTLAGVLATEPDRQELVVGELAQFASGAAHRTSVPEFLAALPAELLCEAAAVSAHEYVGGDRVADALAEGAAARCRVPPPVWITETGVGDARFGGARAGGAGAERARCRRLHRRLAAWHRDPRIEAAFQYTLREDDEFPTGLVTTSLDRPYPALRAWLAWGGERGPRDGPPPVRCD